MSHHNTTVGSYLPSEQLRAASRNSQQSTRPLSAASSQHPYNNSAKGDSTILNISDNSSSLDNAFYNDKLHKCSPKLKSILKTSLRSGDVEAATPPAQQGIDNYIKSRGGQYRKSDSSEVSELESEIGNSELRYSCADMSDVLHSKICRADVSDLNNHTDKCVDDADDASSITSITSGSYVIDPKELCDEIDELFFKNLV